MCEHVRVRARVLARGPKVAMLREGSARLKPLAYPSRDGLRGANRSALTTFATGRRLGGKAAIC